MFKYAAYFEKDVETILNAFFDRNFKETQ